MRENDHDKEIAIRDELLKNENIKKFIKRNTYYKIKHAIYEKSKELFVNKKLLAMFLGYISLMSNDIYDTFMKQLYRYDVTLENKIKHILKNKLKENEIVTYLENN